MSSNLSDRNERTAKKYADIRNDYQQWTNKNYNGIRIYTDGYIFAKLSEKYYLSASTIEQIVFHRIQVKERRK